MTKKLHIKTWGCQMNEYDSSRLDKAFTPHPAWKTRTLLSIWGQQMLA